MPTPRRPAEYDPHSFEETWARYWVEHQTFRAVEDPTKPKYYVLDMFPYPSAAGLHIGHPEGYTATDIVARYKRMRGFSVLHPMGWDAFGLPAEQHAIATGEHPAAVTARNIDNFRRQIQRLGFSYDWSREVSTADPTYYKWTQWIFTKLYERGLAYEADRLVNWCEALGTVLAEEEVIDGRSERGGFPVVRRQLRQWILKITAYAERLIDDLDDLDWPEPVKEMQRNWIGRSVGARVRFGIAGRADTLEVFTTRPDTLFGATYCVLAPEHPLVDAFTTAERRDAVHAYRDAAARKSDLARTDLAKDKTGEFTGGFAVHPLTGEHLPVWVADYVLPHYGTGAVMAVPAHDERDAAFARAMHLPVRVVVQAPGRSPDESEGFTGDGTAVHSDFLNGLSTPAAKQRIVAELEARGSGTGTVQYKLRDWLFSRQRYWGEPMPLYRFDDGTVRTLEADELPLELPRLDDFRPTGRPEGPLVKAVDWISTVDPVSGRPAARDFNTMPQWAGSCWYYLRFVDATNPNAAWSPERERYWMPVDLYVGGTEHAVLHLLYARFWHKVLYDAGYVSTKEPFQKLVNQGMILGNVFYTERAVGNTAVDEARKRVPPAEVRLDNGRAVHAATGAPLFVEQAKMSKSLGNVVSPDDVIRDWGADALRLYEMFLGPLEASKPWNSEGITGVHRFLARLWRLVVNDDGTINADIREPAPSEAPGPEFARVLNETIRKVGDDIEHLRFNTAVSQLMVCLNAMGEVPVLPPAALSAFLRLLAPFAPFIAEELWSRTVGGATIAYEPWPAYDPAALVRDRVNVAVQVNGKVRAEVSLPADADEAAALAAAKADPAVAKWIGDKPVKFARYVPGRMITIAV